MTHLAANSKKYQYCIGKTFSKNGIIRTAIGYKEGVSLGNHSARQAVIEYKVQSGKPTVGTMPAINFWRWAKTAQVIESQP